MAGVVGQGVDGEVVLGGCGLVARVHRVRLGVGPRLGGVRVDESEGQARGLGLPVGDRRLPSRILWLGCVIEFSTGSVGSVGCLGE